MTSTTETKVQVRVLELSLIKKMQVINDNQIKSTKLLLGTNNDLIKLANLCGELTKLVASYEMRISQLEAEANDRKH